MFGKTMGSKQLLSSGGTELPLPQGWFRAPSPQAGLCSASWRYGGDVGLTPPAPASACPARSGRVEARACARSGSLSDELVAGAWGCAVAVSAFHVDDLVSRGMGKMVVVRNRPHP